jgi:general secretion pathway protein I
MTHGMPVRQRTGGFTLIEVLVALAIVAIGMAAVLGALSSSANTISYLRDKTFAEWVALNHVAEERLKGQPPATGNSDGDVDFAGRKWHWRQEVVATEVQGMVRLDVKVRPADIKAGDDNGWFVTVSGISGDAVGAPRGEMPIWGTSTTNPNGLPPGTPGNPGTGTNPGTLAPGTPTPPTPTPGPAPRGSQ